MKEVLRKGGRGEKQRCADAEVMDSEGTGLGLGGGPCAALRPALIQVCSLVVGSWGISDAP